LHVETAAPGCQVERSSTDSQGLAESPLTEPEDVENDSGLLKLAAELRLRRDRKP